MGLKKRGEFKTRAQYELLPPEGGWGYIVAISLTSMILFTTIPMTGFGLIFGKFLASVGDETTGTALTNGMFNTVFSFTGLASNYLLQKYTYRIVGLIGAFIYFIGAFKTIFVESTYQLIISYGVIQGLGFGLMLPAVFTAFNSYFNKKINFVMGIAQAIMVVGNMVFPAIAKCMMDFYGFRGTVALLAAYSLNCFPAMALLQPVEWHMKKKLIKPEITPVSLEDADKELKDATPVKAQAEPLLESSVEVENEVSYQTFIAPKVRKSIISIGERAMSVSTINRLGQDHKKSSIWKTLAETMDLKLFKDPVYLNIACGMSMSFTSDVVFISIMPLILTNVGYDAADVAVIMTVYFGSDLISRIFLSILVAVVSVKNRYLFLMGAIGSAAFRLGFVVYDTYWWKIIMCVCLGFLRCFIQTPLPLVISEKYSENFASAFSLYMVVGGVFSLFFGPLISFVKSVTQSDVMVLHVLTLAYLTCSITWTVEIIWTKLRKQQK